MIVSRVRGRFGGWLVLTTAVAGLLAAAAGCSDDDGGSPAVVVPDSGDPSPGADGALPPPPEAGIRREAGAGTFSLVDLADTPCAARGGTAQEVYAPGTLFSPLQLTRVGARLASRSIDGVVVMNADGTGASASPLVTPIDVGAIASSGGTLLAVGGASNTLRAARIDASGAVAPETLLVSDQPSPGVGAGGGGGAALIAWNGASDLQARSFDEQGAPQPGFLVRTSLAEVLDPVVSVAHVSGDQFAVAHSGRSFEGDYRLTFTRVTTRQRAGTSFTLTSGKTPLRLVQMAATTKGFGLLIAYGDNPRGPAVLVTLDDEGHFTGPARRLLGTMQGFALAASGDELGVITWRGRPSAEAGELVSDAVELRPFSATGEPLGPWVCLDAPTTDVDTRAAAVGEPNGYSILMRTPAQAVALVRVNKRGTGGL